MILAGLEVRQGPLAGPFLKGGRHKVILLDNGLFDGVVHDGGEVRRGTKELPHRRVPQVSTGPAQKFRHGSLTAAGHALDQHIPHGHTPHILRALGGLVQFHARLDQHGVSGRVPEIVHSAVPGTHYHRGAMLDHVVHSGGPHGVHGGPAADILRRVHSGLAAQGQNVTDPLALLRHGPLGVLLSGGAGRPGRGRGGGVHGVLAAHAALAAGRLTAAAVVVRLRVDLALERVKLRLLLRRQAPPGGAGGVHDLLLPLDPLCFVFHALTSILFLLI